MRNNPEAQQVISLLEDPDIYALWLSQWPLEFIAGEAGIPDQEPVAQYLFLSTGQPYWLSERHVMLGEQRICQVPPWVQALRLELAAYHGKEVRVGSVIKALNQARRSGWRQDRAGFSNLS